MTAGPRLLLGVDGGATKTVALVADGTGAVLGAGRTGSSDIHAEADPRVAVARVVDAVVQASQAAGVDPARLDASAFSLCGADWPEDVDYYAGNLVERLTLGGEPTVVNDAFGALRAGTPDGVGVALVLGTGAAIAARGPAGSTWFSGERMEASGGVELGRRAYELLIRGAYGPGPVPTFRSAAMEVFTVDSVEALIHSITRVGGSGRSSLGRLAPVLLEAGHRGDLQARSIILEHATMLAAYVRQAAARVELVETGATVVVSGGLLRHHCTDLMDAIVEGLRGFDVRRSIVEPVYGAVLMAGDRLAACPSIDRLRSSGPDASFFETL